MHSNKLKVNSNKTHLLVIAKSIGGEIRGREVAERRAAVTLTVGGEQIKQSDCEVLLGATVHHSGTMIRDGKASLQAQLRSCVNTLKIICQPSTTTRSQPSTGAWASPNLRQP